MQNSLRQLVNRISGGTPLERHHDIMDRDTPLFPAQLDDVLLLEEPPKNASHQTLDEIQTLQQMPQQLDDRFMEKANHHYVDLLIDCVHHPKRNDELKADVEQIVEEADKFIVEAKYHYNRPRPRQLAAFYDIPLTPLYNPSCPSYPSGHTAKTMVAHLALDRLTDQFSYNRDEAQQLVAKVAYSRLQAKVHFPSDVQAGLAFARQIMNHFLN